MTDPAEQVRGLLADVERVTAAFRKSAAGAAGKRAGASSASAAKRQAEAVSKATREAVARAERAEQAVAILREEREVIRAALRGVTKGRVAEPDPDKDIAADAEDEAS